MRFVRSPRLSVLEHEDVIAGKKRHDFAIRKTEKLDGLAERDPVAAVVVEDCRFFQLVRAPRFISPEFADERAWKLKGEFYGVRQGLLRPVVRLSWLNRFDTTPEFAHHFLMDTKRGGRSTAAADKDDGEIERTASVAAGGPVL